MLILIFGKEQSIFQDDQYEKNIAFQIAIIFLIILMRDGTKGPNQYGEDSLGR